MSVKEKRALLNLITGKNRIHIINDTTWASICDKCNIINECKRQSFDVVTYLKLSAEEVKTFLEKCNVELRRIVDFHFYMGKCSQK